MRSLVVAIGVAVCVLPLASCKSAEQKAMEKVAGAYRYEVSDANFSISKTLTLRADGTATLAVASEMGGTPTNGTLNGAWTIDGTNITARFPGEEGGVFRYRMAGDTLFTRLTPQERMIASTNGMNPDSVDQPLVRAR